MTQIQYFYIYIDLIGSFTVPKINFVGLLHIRQIYENSICKNKITCL